ncbi:MAG: preprotein translocase subunit SecE [Desulfobacterales bacterium]|jgi:preprotein translocase subunit SecE
MGRIQRKKPTAAKKKKTNVEKKSTPGTQAATGSVTSKAAAGDITAQGKKKKFAAPAKKQVTTSSPVATKHKDNIFGKAAQFLREVKVELKKVAWPSRKQTIGSTVVVIALVMIISVFLGAVDLGLSSLIRMVLQ